MTAREEAALRYSWKARRNVKNHYERKPSDLEEKPGDLECQELGGPSSGAENPNNVWQDDECSSEKGTIFFIE